MSIINAFSYLSENLPEREPQPQCDLTDHIEEQYKGYLSSPAMYNMDGWISPYASNNWNSTSDVMVALTDESRLPPFENKLDPNKIFSSDLIALKTLAADQLKLVKLCERKFMDNMKDKGKYGMTEEDVLCLQAITAGRALITNIQKEEVGIKKTATELRIKQQQTQNAVAKSNGMDNGPTPTSTIGIGRSMLDAIFESQGITVDTSNNVPTNVETMDLDSANRMLDEMVNVNIDDHIKYEHLNPTTYVMVGETDDDIEFATYAENGELISDYPNPTTNITELDRDARTAQDSVMNRYPVKFKNEM